MKNNGSMDLLKICAAFLLLFPTLLLAEQDLDKVPEAVEKELLFTRGLISVDGKKQNAPEFGVHYSGVQAFPKNGFYSFDIDEDEEGPLGVLVVEDFTQAKSINPSPEKLAISDRKPYRYFYYDEKANAWKRTKLTSSEDSSKPVPSNTIVVIANPMLVKTVTNLPEHLHAQRTVAGPHLIFEHDTAKLSEASEKSICLSLDHGRNFEANVSRDHQFHHR